MKFKIPKEVTQISKTLRIAETDVKIIEEIAKKENISFNKVVNQMIKFAIENKE
jgi:predicted HicB family RNase H-like nuclease